MPATDPTGELIRHTEVETKLDAGPEFRLPPIAADAAIRAAGIAAVGVPEQLDLMAVYYDTAELDLLRSRLTLRRRTGGADAGWHLKLPAGAGARTEVRAPLSGGGSGGDDDPVPAMLAELVRGAARGRRLVAVARIHTRRTVRPLLDAAGHSLVEIADDEVAGTGLLPAAPGEQRWRELEAEITGGTLGHLDAAVGALLAAGAQPAGAASKLGRLLGTADIASPAQPLSAAAVLATYLARQRDLLVDADIRLREPDPDDEAAHDARAAARRIRSVLRVYRPLLGGVGATAPNGREASAIGSTAVDTVRRALRAWGATLAAVRDWDVALARLEVLFDGGPGVAALRGRLAALRARSVTSLHAELASAGYLTLLRDLDEMVARPTPTGAAAAPAADVMGPLVAAAWLRLRAAAEAVLGLAATTHAAGRRQDDADAVHRLRKDGKTLRYAAEALAGSGAPGGAATGRFAEQVEGIQDILGAHQDAVTVLGLLAGLRVEAGADGGAHGTELALLDRWQQAESDRYADTLVSFTRMWPNMPIVPGTTH